MSRTLTSNRASDLSPTSLRDGAASTAVGREQSEAKEKEKKKEDYTAGADTKAGKHEPHLTPSLLSSTSPNKMVF